MTEEQIITPWSTKCDKSGFDYDKLIEKFGCESITDELMNRIEKLTGKPVHPWLKRKIFFAHRELNKILDDYENGVKFYLYTGRGPTSDSFHLGHMVPFIFTQWLQETFDVPLVIQMADDEKYYFKDMPFDHIYNLGFENAKDIIACGFNPEKTFIFSNRDYSSNKAYKELVCDMNKHININLIKSVFGLENCTVGQLLWPVYQSAAAFSQAFDFLENNMKCCVSYAIDQDPYFRLCRDIAPKLGLQKPCSIMSQFLPALQGDAKMSSTIDAVGLIPTIFMTDSPDDIRKKINKFAFSGGRDTVAEHRLLGADLTVDIPFQYLKYFELDDNILEDIGKRYGSGEMLSGEIKKILADKIITITQEHQIKRNTINQEILDKFYQIIYDPNQKEP